MISAWTKNLKDPKDIERFKNSLLGSKIVLRRLMELLNEVGTDQDRIERDKRVYESPNWAYKQAHLNGFRDCLETIKKIIDLDQEDK
jgi:hypothetical protein